jgi:hypothetical protein
MYQAAIANRSTFTKHGSAKKRKLHNDKAMHLQSIFNMFAYNIATMVKTKLFWVHLVTIV